MKRRDLLQDVLAGVFLLTPLARVVAKTLLEHNGALPAPAAIQRVFAAGPPAAVFLYVLVPEKLLGWPMNLAPAQLAFIHPEQQHLPFVGRLAGRGSTVSLESLLLLAPDVIVDLGNAGVTQRSAAQRLTQQTGIATVQIEGLLAQTPQQLRQAGALLGGGQRAEELALYSEQLLARALRFANTRVQKPAKLYFARSYDGLETGLAGSIRSEVLELLGCENVAKQSGHTGVGQVSVEQLLTWQPDYLLTQDPEFVELATTASEWESLSAVQAGRIYCAPKLPFGWLDGPPGVNRLLGVLWLMALLEGQVFLHGQPLHQHCRCIIAQQVGYVPQAQEGQFAFNVLDMVLMGRAAHLGLFAHPCQEDQQLALHTLSELGIAHLAACAYPHISGGERQLTLIARALLQQPKVLVLDEPTASLDFANQILVLEQIQRLRAQGLGVLLCTHQPEHAWQVADRLALFKQGRIEKTGSVTQLGSAENLAWLYNVSIEHVYAQLKRDLVK